MFIDTHAHLYLKQFNDDQQETLSRARRSGVEKILLPDIDASTTDALWNLVDESHGICLGMSGLHPCSVKADFESQLEHVFRIAEEKPVVAIGETGLDYYWDTSLVKEQKAAFDRQILYGREHDLPIVIHSRDSLDDTIAMIEARQDGRLKGVFHCFNGNLDQMKRIEDVGFLMGLGGVVTFKNAKMDGVLKEIGSDAYVFETDAPYLSPVPYRGKRNESSYLPLVAQKMADVRKEDLAVLEAESTDNALRVFSRV